MKAMETVEGTELPLEAGREEHVSLRPPASDPTTPMAKLAEADRHLLAIGAEVATLREELARLREEAGERAELLSEREMVIAELSGLLPTLEEARVSAVRQAEGASAALTRSEARLAEQAGRFAELERQLATVDATNAAHQQVVVELEARLEAERTKREGSERALVAAQAHTQSVERSLAEARSRLESLSGDHERLLAERAEERAQAQRQADETSAALARHVASLSELGTNLARVRSEHEVRSVAVERPHVAAESASLTQLRFVLRVGGVRDATNAVVDALLVGSKSSSGVRLLGDNLRRSRERLVIEAQLRRGRTPASALPRQTAALEAGKRLAKVLRPGNGASWGVTIRRSPRAARHSRAALPVRTPAISGVPDSKRTS
jgi:hypothetical protein